MLRELQFANHFGIAKTTSLARSYLYWPGTDNDIETICLSNQSAPPKNTLTPWKIESRSWIRVHIDCCAPINNTKIPVIILWLFLQMFWNTSSSLRERGNFEGSSQYYRQKYKKSMALLRIMWNKKKSTQNMSIYQQSLLVKINYFLFNKRRQSFSLRWFSWFLENILQTYYPRN